MNEPANAEDAEHLSALSIGHFIMSGLALLGAVPMMVYGVAGAKLMDELGSDLSMAMGDIPGQVGANPFGGSPDAMLQDLGTLVNTMIVAGVLLALLSAVHLLVVGLALRQRRWWTFCYLTGWGECLMFPFGTILGVFTIIVLSRPSVKRLFGVP
ncbi:MAG: hypothetical protein WCE62_02330 [Polyangiales bacterium]